MRMASFTGQYLGYRISDWVGLRHGNVLPCGHMGMVSVNGSWVTVGEWGV